MKSGEINLDALRRERDQLFAEAVTLYRAGAHWWPDRDFEQQTIAPEQETRYEPDAWEPLIRDFLEEVNRTTMLIIAVGALGYELNPHHNPGLANRQSPAALQSTASPQTSSSASPASSPTSGGSRNTIRASGGGRGEKRHRRKTQDHRRKTDHRSIRRNRHKKRSSAAAFPRS